MTGRGSCAPNPPRGDGSGSTARDFLCAQDIDDGVACWNYGGPLRPPYGPALGTPYAAYAVGVTGFVGILASNGRAEAFGEGQEPPGPLVDIAAGQSSACGIRSDDGTTACVAWDGPALPIGLTTIDGYESDFCWLDATGLADCVLRPPVASRDGFDPSTEIFSSVSAGHDHACAVTPDGRGFCWPRDGRPETSGIPERP